MSKVTVLSSAQLTALAQREMEERRGQRVKRPAGGREGKGPR